MTRTKLYRAAGVAAVVAGLIFVLLQFIHPDETVENVTTSTWKAVHVLTLVMTVLALIGVLGIYLRQVNESGVLGLIGVALYGCGFFIIYGFSFVEAAVLPQLADTNPRYVADVIELTATGQADGELGGLAAGNVASGVTYILGGVLFGVRDGGRGAVALGRGAARDRSAVDQLDPGPPGVARQAGGDTGRRGVGWPGDLALGIDIHTCRVRSRRRQRPARRDSGLAGGHP